MIRRFIAVVGLVFCVHPAFAALVEDTHVASGHFTGNTSWNHTISASTNLFIVSCGYARGSSTITAVTVGGASMTLYANHNETGASAEIYYKTNPSTGIQSVAVTVSTSDSFACESYSFEDANATTPLINGQGAFHTDSTQFSDTITCPSGSLVVDAAATSAAITSITPDASQTGYTVAGTQGNYGASTKPGAGSTTMIWDLSSTTHGSTAQACIQPAAAATRRAPTPVIFQ